MTKREFVNDVVGAGRPAVVDFGASWCAPCRALAPVMDDLAREYGGRVNVVRLDVDDAADLAREHDVVALPTVLFFRSGRVVDRVHGNDPARVRAKAAALLS